MNGTNAVLLYDGLCGLCDRTVQFITKHDRKRTLRYAALQGNFSARLAAQFPALRTIDSLVFVERGADDSVQQVLVRSDAVLAIASYLGGSWRLLGRVGRLIPAVLRNRAYDALAKRRLRVFGRLDSCRLPTVEERARFLE